MASETQRPICTVTRKDGKPCTAFVSKDGRCVGHQPDSNRARSKGGTNSSKAARLNRLVPTRLRPVFDKLEKAMDEVHSDNLDPKQANAMASLARAMVAVLTAGELEQRVRGLEDKFKGTE